MGNMEEESKKERRKNYIQQAVLATVATAGILAVAAVAPCVFAALPAVVGKKRYKLTFQTNTALQRLAIKGHIKFVNRKEKRLAEITEEGRRAMEIELARANELARAKRKRRWDHRYRMVIFDIPEYRKGVRERLRRLMREFGFLRLQDSVWISPYDCEDLVALVKAELRIGKDVLYIIADTIENDRWIKDHFGLK